MIKIDKLFAAAERFFHLLRTGNRNTLKQVKDDFKGIVRKQKEERSYYAATTNSPSGRWNPSSRADADTDILKDGAKVRARIRDLERNNSQIFGALNRYVLNTVGDGMYFQSKVSENNIPDRETSNIIENYVESWGEKGMVNGDSFWDMQQLGLRTFLRDGEVFIVKRFIDRKLKYQIIEADQLDESYHGRIDEDTYAVKGIIFSKYGLPLYYQVLDCHPGDSVITSSSFKSTRIPASDVMHLLYKKRPSQKRGISEFASIIMDVFDSGEYTDATLTLARIAAAYGIFVETPYPDEHIDLTEEESVIYGNKAMTKNIGYVQPGALHYVRPGENVKTVNPSQPTAVYESFIATRDRRAAVGVGQSYESFAGDYSKSTYSSARQGMLLERQLYRFFSSLLDRKLNYPVLEQVLDYGVLSRQLLIANYFLQKPKYLKGRFTRPRHEWIDLANEAKSNVAEIQLGIKTRRQISEDRGDNWEDLVTELAAEENLMRKLGLSVPANFSQGSSRPLEPVVEPVTGQEPLVQDNKPVESEDENADNKDK